MAAAYMSTQHTVFFFFFVFIIASAFAQPGSWQRLMNSAGIASMHSAVTRFGTVVLLDRNEIGASQLPLPQGQCGADPECTAHSALFDPTTNTLRPLNIVTDTVCSSGTFLPDGTLLQTGGSGNGWQKIRTFTPCNDGNCDWVELDTVTLAVGRWYSTNQILPDGTVIIVGGIAQDSIEFYPPNPNVPTRYLPLLHDTSDAQYDNLYPYVLLLPDGNLFIFSNQKSILYEYSTGNVLQNYPDLEGGPWVYPCGGSAVLLPLNPADYSKAEILICGGSFYGVNLNQQIDAPARATCGRIVATDPNPTWATEDMPIARAMGDMVILPTGNVVIINGAQTGSQGYERANNPALNPVLYSPDAPAGSRFATLAATTTPRMYHSTANLLPDGRILLAGSNPHFNYQFGDGVSFPTELSLDAFSPDYLDAGNANARPSIQVVPASVGYGVLFNIEVTVGSAATWLEVNIASAPFTTHSFSQGQRMVKLSVGPPIVLIDGSTGGTSYRYQVGCWSPPSGKVAPPGYYMFFVVNNGVPSVASWIQLLP